jgi:hypothetical protein
VRHEQLHTVDMPLAGHKPECETREQR